MNDGSLSCLGPRASRRSPRKRVRAATVRERFSWSTTPRDWITQKEPLPYGRGSDTLAGTGRDVRKSQGLFTIVRLRRSSFPAVRMRSTLSAAFVSV